MAIFNCYVSSPEGNGLNGTSPLKTHGLFVESAGIPPGEAGRTWWAGGMGMALSSRRPG